MTKKNIQLGERGVLTIPQKLRKTYRLKPGDTLTLLDLGGAFILSPYQLEIDSLASEVREELEGYGENLESMLAALRKERDKNKS